MDRSTISCTEALCWETGLCIINEVQNDAENQHFQMQGKIQYCIGLGSELNMYSKINACLNLQEHVIAIF